MGELTGGVLGAGCRSVGGLFAGLRRCAVWG